MHIQHIVNSFFVVQANANKDVMWLDPWSISANLDGIFPYYKVPTSFDLNPSWVYVSHIHDDHYCSYLIEKYCLNGTKFVIKKFMDRLLKNKLSSFGVKPENIIELSERTPFRINKLDLCICIFGQLQSNEAFVQSSLDYDMDTSIFVSDGVESFYNQVDCSASNDQILDIAGYCMKNIGPEEITYYSSLYGGGSEYPQCFLDLPRKICRDSLISAKLEAVFESVQLLSPKVYIPAGASYILDDQRSDMTNYIAVPSKDELASFWRSKLSEYEQSNKNSSVIMALTEGSASFNMDLILNNLVSSCLYFPNPILFLNAVYGRPSRRNTVDYSDTYLNNLIDQLFSKLRPKLHEFTTSTLSFHILRVERLTDKEFNILSGSDGHQSIDLSYNISSEENSSLESTDSLQIYFAVEDFVQWCLGKNNFNNLSCGSHLFFKRTGGFDWPLYTFFCRLRI